MKIMADRGILFSAPMVRALLAGTKTQTRRVHKLPGWDIRRGPIPPGPKLPFAKGDRLWVREAWRTETAGSDTLSPAQLVGESPRVPILFEADADWGLNKTTGRLRASMHLPRLFSRLTLHVTDVRVQRLRDITDEDAAAEGIVRVGGRWEVEEIVATPFSPRDAYRSLWGYLNGPESWSQNPWVAAATFTVERANIDAARP